MINKQAYSDFIHSPGFLSSEIYKSQWHLHGRLPDGSYCTSVNAEKAWVRLNNFGCEEVIIAFADDGCQMKAINEIIEDSFISSVYLEKGNIISGHPKSLEHKMYIPDYKHGTALAGLISGPPSLKFPMGVAPGCRLLPIRWEYDHRFRITQKGFHAILKHIENKVDVFINTWASLPDMLFSTENLDLIKKLSNSGGRRGKGILFIWAGGNANCPINYTSDIQIPYRGFINKNKKFTDGSYSRSFSHSLSNIDNVLLVSAVNFKGQRSHYSCYGPGISLCAPSSNSHCFEAVTFDEPGLTTRSADSIGYTHNFKGTSGAAAIVAGAAALVISANPELYARDLAEILRATASKELNSRPYENNFFAVRHPALTATEVSDSPIECFNNGFFDRQGWSPWFGYGLVDANAAVKAALNLKVKQRHDCFHS